MLKTSKKVSMMLLLGSLSTGLVHATIGMDVAGDKRRSARKCM